MQASKKWFFCAARLASTGEFVGWLGASDGGNVQFFGGEGDDPGKLSGVEYVGFETIDGKTVLRAPNYHLHDSAFLGGADLQGYYATWKWAGHGAYGLKLGGDGVLTDENDRILSLYVFGLRNEASWECKRGANTLKLEFVPARV